MLKREDEIYALIIIGCVYLFWCIIRFWYGTVCTTPQEVRSYPGVRTTAQSIYLHLPRVCLISLRQSRESQHGDTSARTRFLMIRSHARCHYATRLHLRKHRLSCNNSQLRTFNIMFRISVIQTHLQLETKQSRVASVLFHRLRSTGLLSVRIKGASRTINNSHRSCVGMQICYCRIIHGFSPRGVFAQLQCKLSPEIASKCLLSARGCIVVARNCCFSIRFDFAIPYRVYFVLMQVCQFRCNISGMCWFPSTQGRRNGRAHKKLPLVVCVELTFRYRAPAMIAGCSAVTISRTSSSHISFGSRRPPRPF